MPFTHNKRKMLVVLAHPDDESFGMGGTLARYVNHGVEVHLICVTGGEAGTVEAQFLKKFTSVAELRTAELRCAAAKLGLQQVIQLGYRDSGMPGAADNQHPEALVQQPVEAVAERIVRCIREIQPQVVITHDPIGGYKHPDHIAVHKATVHAFYAAGDPTAYPEQALPAFTPAKLYYHTLPKHFLKFAAFVLRLSGRDPHRFGRNQDVDLAALIEEGDFPIHARINYRAFLKQRQEASACHASQLAGGPPNRGLFSWLLRLFGGTDTFMRAYPEPFNGLREIDLFADL